MAIFTITTNEYVNLPPDVVGDGSATTDHNVAYVFTTNDFTVDTSPPYNDPEGDSAANLKLLTLPSTGVIEYNSTPALVSQIISFADIGAGLLSYIPDAGTTIEYVDTFDFEIADSGSGIFVG